MAHTIAECFSLLMKVIQKRAMQTGDSPKAIARQYIEYLGGPATTGYALSDHDLQTGDWADLSPGCPEYSALRRWMTEYLHDASLDTLIIGFNTRKVKSEIAKKPRSPKAESGKTIDDLINNLARYDEPAKSLWDRFQGDMDAEFMSPIEYHPTGTFSDKSKITYIVGDNKKRAISFGTFKKKLSQYRNKED